MKKFLMLAALSFGMISFIGCGGTDCCCDCEDCVCTDGVCTDCNCCEQCKNCQGCCEEGCIH